MIAEIHRWSDLERWLPGGGAALDVAFPTVQIGDFLSRVSRPIDKKQRPLDSLNVIAKISFGGQLYLRTDKQKSDYKGPLFEALPGELIISKIRAGQGSLCVVPDDIDHLAVSPEYPIYRPDPTQVRVRYLNLLLRTPQFQHLLSSSSSGNTTKKRISPSEFEEIEVPLPELLEQDRLLEAFDAALEQAELKESAATELKREGLREFEAALGFVPPSNLPRQPFQIAWFSGVDRWSHEGILDQKILTASGKPTEKYPLVSLGEVISDLENGWSPQCLGRPAKEGEWGVLKLGAVSYGFFDEAANKALPSKLKPISNLEVRPGDVLISRANILRLVGACALVLQTRPQLMLNDKIFRVVFRRESLVLPEFLTEILKTPSVRQQIEANATGTSPTMKNISKPALLDLMFPLPDGDESLKIQETLINTLQEARQQAALKKAEATQLRSAAWAEFQAAIFR